MRKKSHDFGSIRLAIQVNNSANRSRDGAPGDEP